MKKAIAILVATAATLGSFETQASSAQMRTFVSGKGRDNPSCSATSPCRTLQAALRLTLPGGTIFVLDSADYGPVVIDKAISIRSRGALAGVLALSGTAIKISAGPRDVVNLHGLAIDGGRSGTIGVQFISGQALNMQNSNVRDFADTAISFSPTAASSLMLTDVAVDGNTNTGVLVASNGNAVGAVLHRVNSSRNGVGVLATGAATTLTISDAILNNNNSGVSATSSNVMVRNTVISNNKTGIASAQAAVVRLVQSAVTANAVGLTTSTNGQLQSYGDNNIYGNTVNGSASRTLTLQ